MFYNFFKEFLRSFFDFKKYLKLRKENKEIIFYAENEGQWDFFKDIIKYLTLKKKLHICYITSSQTDGALKRKLKNFHSFYVGLSYIRTIFFSTLNTKILITSLADLDNLEIKRSKFSVHYIYVPHTLLSTHMIFREKAFDNYDTFFCSSPNHIKEIRETERINKSKNKKLVKFGYSRIDKIIKRKKLKKVYKYKIKVLIAPSWGKNSLFETGAKELIDFLLKKNYVVTIRPHPETLKLNQSCIDKLLLNFKNKKNFFYKPNTSFTDDYFNNDILISDWSGAAFEYALGTLKPVIFLNLPKKINNKNYKKIKFEPIEIKMRKQIGVIVEPKNFIEIEKKIKFLLNTETYWKKKLLSIRKKTIYNLGNSGLVGGRYIYDLINK